VREAEHRRVEQRPAADVVQQDQSVLVGERRQIGQRHGLGEADDFEVGGVGAHDAGRPLVQGSGIVAQARAVGRAHFDHDRPALGHYVRHAERPADLDKLPPADDRRATLGQRRQREQHARRVVVDDHPGLSAGDSREDALNVLVALAARPFL